MTLVAAPAGAPYPQVGLAGVPTVAGKAGTTPTFTASHAAVASATLGTPALGVETSLWRSTT